MALLAAGCQAAPLPADRPLARPPADLPTARMQKPDAPSGSLLQVGNHLFQSPGQGQVDVRVRAWVNGSPILDDEVREAAFEPLMQSLALPEPERTRVQGEIIARELERIIDREVILTEAMAKLEAMKRPQYMEKLREAAAKEFDKAVRSYKERAKKSGLPIQSDEELKALLKAQGQSLDGIRRQIERSFIAMEYMRSRIFPIVERNTGHQHIREYYEQHPDEFRVEDRVVWQDIFIDATRFANREQARQLAEHVAARARKGDDFPALGRQYDQGDSSWRNGEGYGQRRGEIQPAAIEPYLFAMQPGQVGPVVEIGNGFHVFRLAERQHAGLRPLDEKTQLEIKKKLQNLIADREYKRILGELKRKATIERDIDP
jgi:parvulin-like peptidyl-prolyl isomerase